MKGCAICFRDTSKVWISVGRCVPVNVLREIRLGARNWAPKSVPKWMYHDVSMCWKSVREIVKSAVSSHTFQA
jgi:hypothetical protein